VVELVPVTIERLVGTWTKKVVVAVWGGEPEEWTVRVLFPAVALAATARSTTRLVLVVDFTVGVMPVGAVTVAPLRPVPPMVTEETVAPPARYAEIR
jgi:hypothetical protein